MTGDRRIRIKAHELMLLQSAVSHRQSHWRVELSRATRYGDQGAQCDAVKVLGTLDRLARKLGGSS